MGSGPSRNFFRSKTVVTEIEKRHPGEPNVGFSEALGEHASLPPIPREVAADVVVAFDKEWKVSPLEQRIKALFEQEIRKNAILAVQEVEELGNPELSRKMMSAYIADRSSGAYNWDGSVCRTSRGDLPGLRHLFHLLLARCGSVDKDDRATSEAVFNANPKAAVTAIHWAVGNEVSPAKKPGTNGRQNAPAKQVVQTMD